MLWEKWRNMGKRKQGIWFTRYAYGHSIWQTQGIWPLCSLGRAGKWVPHTHRVCVFLPQHADLVLITGTCLSEQAAPSTLFTFRLSEMPFSLCLLSIACCLQTPRLGFLLQILRNIYKPQTVTPAAMVFSGGWEEGTRFISLWLNTAYTFLKA